MPVIPIAEWIPDAADLGNPGSITVTNAVPGLNSYKPINQLVATTDSLTDRPRGAIEAKDASQNIFDYAGDETNLYELSGGTWSDISGATYATAAEENWEFVRWKEKIIATNFTDNPQAITLGGVSFANLTTALRFRHVGVVRDFVVAGNTWDATDGEVRDRVRWCAINDETDWTPSATTLADFRDLKAGGGIQRVIGGEYGVLLAEKSTWRMTFVGTPTIFQIDETVPGVGCLSPGSATVLAGIVFYASEHGFVALQGGTRPTFIGDGKVDEFFRNDLDEDYLYRISSVADPESGRVYWAYPGAGNTGGRPNKLIVYDRVLDRWGYAELEIELIWRSGGVATTLEQLDSVSASIDALPSSLDSSQWKGGAAQLAGFDSSFANGNFTGSPMTAIMETKEVEINPGRRTQLNAFLPMVDGGSVSARVGTRNRQSDSVSYSATLNQSSTGRFTTRANAKFHRFELTASGLWTDIIGVQVNPREDGKQAGGRG